MPIYNIANQALTKLQKTTFAAVGLKERQHLQEAIKCSIEIVAPDCLVICDEFSGWEGSLRRIDLLAIDKSGNLVVIELKRDETGAHMELQAVRYAAMIANMTFDKACEYFQSYLQKEKDSRDARQTILDFLDLDEQDIDNFGLDVRIILASADFSKELTTSVLWLRDKSIDISCVRLTPYRHQNSIFINSEQIIPVPEAESYQIKFRQKRAEEKSSQAGGRDYSQFEYDGQVYNKRNLALVLMTDWIDQQSPLDLTYILSVFDKSIQRRIAIPLDEIASSRMDRFHSDSDAVITLRSGECIAISNQWSIGSITRLIEKMATFGINVTKVSD